MLLHCLQTHLVYRKLRGIFIKSVTPEGHAVKAGITPFNIIFSVDGNVVKDESELIDYIENSKLPGDEISLNIIT